MHSEQILKQYLNELKIQASDSLNIDQEKSFKKQAGQSEFILISRNIGKINKRNTEQQRTIVVTSENLYNIDKKSIKRKIQIQKVFGVTVSRSSFEFILHVPQETDYRYKSQENRDIILFYLSISLKLNNKDGLKLYLVDQEDLQQFCLHQKTTDLQKQVALHPKTKLLFLYPHDFQLQYINMLNQPTKSLNPNHKITVLFINDKMKFRVKLEDFQKNTIISSGSLNKILLLTQKNDRQKVLVLKTIRSCDIDVDLMEFFLKNYEVEPFVEQLELCIRQTDLIHFFFKFVKGGDLFAHLQYVGSFTENQTKYIIAQVGMALQSVHEKGITFGDIKPENILIDEQGYIYLTDFGYGKLRVYQECKKQQNINFSVEYASPEYLRFGDLTRMSDWYSMGILLYELLVGISPFYNANQDVAIKLICQGELHFPKGILISNECKDLISRLLQQDSSQRIGFSNDFKEIQAHPWFQDIDWTELKQKKKELPYIPSIIEGTLIQEQYIKMEFLSDDEKGWY
ncbi:unnamed protein product (macronuclear) [Paramecium tetraurelia]|uniref:Protein kinase domain-containing protein n=1 Tax=Paramecium tetraurelia TaxID=5888 RepID=A0DCS6_PARTE|nr:uncharacterized protein GSPATT00015702001 [Paramecium tetraurelia]CAK80843.1 unnamed protein product [Paramecium tetraurelia]|eukprot:XP_001448240.1 hypothetical protein (macronuclear) [Paramecium tetraurelia strain d4-2]